MTIKDNLEGSKLEAVKEAVAKVVSGELTVEEAAKEFSIDESILESFVAEEVQGEKLKDGKKKGYDDGSEETNNPGVDGEAQLKGKQQPVKEAKEKGSDKEDEADDKKKKDEDKKPSDEELEEAFSLAEEGFEDLSDEQLDEAFQTDGMKKYKAAKALLARMKKKHNDGGKLTTADYEKIQKASTFVSQSDRAGAMKKSGGKTDGITKFRESTDLDNDLSFQDKVSREDIAIDVKEHLDAFFKGEELSEDFREKIKNIFESAIVESAQNIITKNVAKLEEKVQVEVAAKVDALEEANEVYKEELNKRVDEYLAYTVESWMEENKPVVQANIRTDLTESFINGLKTLFEEHYIDIPEDKVDIVEGFTKQIEENEEALARLIEENAGLKAEKVSMIKESVFAKVSSSLSENEKERFSALSEGVEFKDEDNYAKALETIRESYFEENTGEVLGVDHDEVPLNLNEEVEVPAKEAKPTDSIVEYMKRSIRK
jgi:hypothetical protein